MLSLQLHSDGELPQRLLEPPGDYHLLKISALNLIQLFFLAARFKGSRI